MASGITTDKLSREQLTNIVRYVTAINEKKSDDIIATKRWRSLSLRLNSISKGDKNALNTFLINYNKAELVAIDILETVITVLENALFLLKYLKNSPKWTKILNALILKTSKIWMVLTVKSSVWRFWKLTKLEMAGVLTDQQNTLISKAKSYTLINLGLCLVEIIELLDLNYFSWLISIYNIYRMVGNGSLCLDDDEEKLIQALFLEFSV